jgi:hypothetical protein
MMTIEEYRAAILKALLDAKNEDGTPAITAKEAEEALRGFTDDELNDGILYSSIVIMFLMLLCCLFLVTKILFFLQKSKVFSHFISMNIEKF